MRMLQSRILVMDGAMGTFIQARGLDEAGFRGEQFKDHTHDLKGNNDLLCLTQPEIIADIHRELQERGFDLDRKRILLEHPIKELGAYDVEVSIHRDISVTLPVRVVRPGEDPDAIAPEFVAEGRLEVADEDLSADGKPLPEATVEETRDEPEPEATTESTEKPTVSEEPSGAEEGPETATTAE